MLGKMQARSREAYLMMSALNQENSEHFRFKPSPRMLWISAIVLSAAMWAAIAWPIWWLLHRI
jgi:hypothetical protein